LIEGRTALIEVNQSPIDKTDYIAIFSGGERLYANLAMLLDRESMERWAIGSLDAWLEGPEDQEPWASFVRKLAGLPEPEPPKPAAPATTPPPVAAPATTPPPAAALPTPIPTPVAAPATTPPPAGALPTPIPTPVAAPPAVIELDDGSFVVIILPSLHPLPRTP
jgi:hypothetical protein